MEATSSVNECVSEETTVKAPLLSLVIPQDEETEAASLSATLDSINADTAKANIFSPTHSDLTSGTPTLTPTLTPSGTKTSRGKWTPDEDEVLRESVLTHGGRNWKKISEFLDGRTDVQCLHRWQKVLRPGLVKGPWTKEEDDKVVELVGEFGVKSWSFIARKLEGRLGKQCRERWYNHLNPDINKEPWSAEEDRLITEEHEIHGNKWAEIAKSLPGRTDNAIKNRWNSTLQRLLRAPAVKKVKAPRVKKAPKKKELVAKKEKAVKNTASNNEDDDADSICLSVDTESMQTDEDNESEGCTTVSSICSESLSPSPALDLELQHDRENRHNLTLISQLQNCNEIWQRKNVKKQKSTKRITKTKSRVRPFSPCSDSSSGMLSPLDALLIAADSSFTTLNNSGKSTSRGKDELPCSPSILRRRQSRSKQSKQTDCESSAHNSDKLQQLALLSTVSFSTTTVAGSISLRGEEFCISPKDVKKSEASLLSPYGCQNQYGEESPTKRRKFADTSFLKNNTGIISGEPESIVEHGSEEDIIALSLLHMKTAHTLVRN